MSLNFKRLPTSTDVGDKDNVLVQGDSGVKQVPISEFGITVSSKSLFETYTKLLVGDEYVEFISTSNKIRRYFAGDTSNEIYLDIGSDKLSYKYAQVYFVNATPEEEQVIDWQGNPLYWSADTSTSDWADGLPYTDDTGRKVYMSAEVTAFPVMSYRYLVSEIQSTTFSEVVGGEPIISDTYKSGQDNLKGIISKTDSDFGFMLTSSKGSCGIQLVRNSDGSLSGSLIGDWDGINDIDIDSLITKQNMKEQWYLNQDLYTYTISDRLDTSDKVGWRLSNDTSNKMFAELKEDNLSVFLAVPNQNIGTGQYIQEQAVNIFGNKLYWTVSMSSGAGVTQNNIPLKNGQFTYMTTQVTPYPVYVYQYTYYELFSVTYNPVKGVVQNFKDSSGNQATIYKSATGLTIDYTPNGTTTTSSVNLNATGGSLVGAWTMTKFSGSAGELLVVPSGSSAFITPVLSYYNSNPVWIENQRKYDSLAATGGVCTINMKNNLDHVITTVNSSITMTVKVDTSVVNGCTIENKVLIASNNTTINWGSNVVVNNSEKDTAATGVTEFTLTYYAGYSTDVYLSRKLYGQS